MFHVARVILFLVSVINVVGAHTCTNWTIPAELRTFRNNNTDCNSLFEIGNCMTCNTTTCATELGTCRLTLELNEEDGFIVFRKPNHYLVSACSCEELNVRVCGPFNREGLLCSKCKPGYGPALYSWSLKCEKCCDEYVGWFWLLYLLLELVLLTVFYLMVILLNIHVTSPPFTAFVFFCQLFTILFKENVYLNIGVIQYRNKIFLYIISTLISIWNLDIFRYLVPPFCVSSKLTDVDTVLLEYISVLYPLLLILITYIGIELHARNFSPVVTLWKPFHKCFSKCRRTLDPTSSVIAAFSTFISLSFTKSLYITYSIVSPRHYYVNGIRHVSLLLDPSFQSVDNDKQLFSALISTWYFIPSVIFVIFTYFPVILLLLLYPLKIFRKLLRCCCGGRKYHTIYVFMNTFQGHYKDSTSGTRDYRAVSCLNFLIRFGICWMFYDDLQSKSGIPIVRFSYLVHTLILTSLFYGIVQPCKKKYMNVIESLLYCTAGLLLLYFTSAHYGVHHYKIPTFMFNFSMLLVTLPSLILTCVFMWKVLKSVCLCTSKKRRLYRSVSEASLSDVLPDRETHPSSTTTQHYNM